MESLLDKLEQKEIERIIYFNPGDPDWIPLWNPLGEIPCKDHGTLADNIVGVYKTLVIGWGDRLESILRHCIFALLHIPNGTLLDITDLLQRGSQESKALQKLILDVVKNAIAQQFWKYDFAEYSSSDFSPPKNKLSKLLVSETVDLMLFHSTSTVSFTHE